MPKCGKSCISLSTEKTWVGDKDGAIIMEHEDGLDNRTAASPLWHETTNCLLNQRGAGNADKCLWSQVADSQSPCGRYRNQECAVLQNNTLQSVKDCAAKAQIPTSQVDRFPTGRIRQPVAPVAGARCLVHRHKFHSPDTRFCMLMLLQTDVRAMKMWIHYAASIKDKASTPHGVPRRSP